MWIKTDTKLERIESMRIEKNIQNSTWSVYAHTLLAYYVIYTGTKEECDNCITNIINRLTYSEKRIIFFQ